MGCMAKGPGKKSQRAGGRETSVTTPATSVLTQAGVAFSVHVYDHDSRVTSYGQEAAAALGVDAARVFKTLVVQVDGADLVMAVLPVSHEANLKSVAGSVGGKNAQLADAKLVTSRTGYVFGGVSPLGSRTHLPVILDTSADGYPTIFVSAGRRGADVEVAPDALVRLSGAMRASIVRER